MMFKKVGSFLIRQGNDYVIVNSDKQYLAKNDKFTNDLSKAVQMSLPEAQKIVKESEIDLNIGVYGVEKYK